MSPSAAAPFVYRLRRTAAGLLLAAAAVAVQAQPAPAADASRIALHALAATCANCHGSEGRPADAAMPPLAGLPQAFVVAQMRAFRSGERPATVMHQIARGYTEAQVQALAGYFASLPGPAR